MDVKTLQAHENLDERPLEAREVRSLELVIDDASMARLVQQGFPSRKAIFSVALRLAADQLDLGADAGVLHLNDELGIWRLASVAEETDDQAHPYAGFEVPDPPASVTAPGRKNAAPVYRTFPFAPGSKPGSRNWPAAKDALKVFAVLHEAHGARRLKDSDLQPLFFRSSSDLITYREGWKAGRFWSVGAWKQACANGHTNGLVSEHVLPRSLALRTALAMPLRAALEFVWHTSFECVVTQDENARLPADTGYPHDPWARYAKAGIQVLDAQDTGGRALLTDADRATLSAHGILAPWNSANFD